jgi:hypothetical protein
MRRLIFAIAVSLAAQTVMQVTGEIAVRGDLGWGIGWTLKHAPRIQPTCYLNGLRLGPDDFTVRDKQIISPYWAAATDDTDVLACDYTYLDGQ